MDRRAPSRSASTPPPRQPPSKTSTSTAGSSQHPSPPLEIRWTSLSELSQATLRRIVIPLSCGCSKIDLARSIGISASYVQPLLDLLADELMDRPPS